MSILSQLGLTLVTFSEPAHGSPEVHNSSVVPPLGPEMTDNLVLGGSVFTSEYLKVADDHFLVFNLEVPGIISVFTKLDEKKIAQVGIDGPFKLKNSPRPKGKLIVLGTGVHHILPDEDGDWTVEYFFITLL